MIHYFRKARAELDAFEPDFVLVWGDDQYENFREDGVAPFALLAYDSIDVQPWSGHQRGENWWDEPADKTFTVTGHRTAASPYRVAVIASSSWSHSFLVEKNARMFPDTESDKRYYEALRDGDWRRGARRAPRKPKI